MSASVTVRAGTPPVANLQVFEVNVACRSHVHSPADAVPRRICFYIERRNLARDDQALNLRKPPPMVPSRASRTMRSMAQSFIYPRR